MTEKMSISNPRMIYADCIALEKGESAKSGLIGRHSAHQKRSRLQLQSLREDDAAVGKLSPRGGPIAQKQEL